MVILYFTGILMAVLMAMLMKQFVFKGEAVPFVMELPNYRLPGAKNVGQLLWEKAKDFLQRAFTVIFVATMVIWFFQTFDLRLNVVTDSKDSILAAAASWIAPIFKPLGFWRLEDFYCTDHRIYGKGECGIDSVGIVWFHRGSVGGYDTSGRQPACWYFVYCIHHALQQFPR